MTSSGTGNRRHALPVRRLRHQHALFEALDRQNLAAHQAVLDIEARPAEPGDPGLDGDLVAESRRDVKRGAGIDDGPSDDVVAPDEPRLREARRLEVMGGRAVEPAEVPGEEHDVGRIAVAPFDRDGTSAGEHSQAPLPVWRTVPCRMALRRSDLRNGPPTFSTASV